MSEGKLVWIYAPGVCDLFHPGHVEFFRQARSLGDRVIAGIVSEATAADYKPAPIMTMAERIAVVSACRYVDRVLPDAPRQVTVDFLDSIGADYAVHGDDITPEELERSFPGLVAAGRMKFVPYTRTVSSRQLIERIANRLRDGTLRVKL
ncbi:MAG TPA: adenylyltransferase/cytidyltransferase family protein [Alphaproteobacteria bacterium]